MRTLLLTITCCLLFATAEAQRREETGEQTSSRQTDAVSAGTDEVQGPLLRLEDPVWNFGDVPRKGGDVAHDFRFCNEGGKPLVILRVITSCSCVKASFPKRPVAPGETGVIRITYEPHKSEPGVFNKVIRIHSNSTAGRDILTVQGNSLEDEPHGKMKSEKTRK